MPETAEITQVLQAIGRSEEGAAEKLLPLVYAELRRLAAGRMAHELAGQTLQPTALVHEAWLRLVADGDRTWQNRAHFFGAAAEAMRRILIERARHKSRLKHGGGQSRLNIEDLELAETTPDDKVLLVDEGLARLKEEDTRTGAHCRVEILWGLEQCGNRRGTGTCESHAGPAVGLCQGLAVSLYQRAQVNAEVFFIILAKVVCLCRIRGQWTNEYSSPARKGSVC